VLQNGIAYGVRGVGPMQLATRTLVSVGNNQRNCILLPEMKSYIPRNGAFARKGFPLGHFILKCIGVLSCDEMSMCEPPDFDIVAQAILQ
jgi:hypothetical protein